jgi:hypothetical protein
MPLYSVEFSRTQSFITQVEAESLGEARAKAEQMSRSDVLCCHADDDDLELDGVFPIDEHGDPIDEPESTRLGGDELVHCITESSNYTEHA